MQVSGINSTNSQVGQMGGFQTSDPVSKSIQKQIENAKKRLQELSSNEEMSMEEKMKKRQEIQKEITDLNQQLRQHQIELRKEMQQKKHAANEEKDQKRNTEAANSGKKGTGMSQAGMKAMLTADSAMDQAQVYNNVSTDMKGRASVLEVEIRLDASRGASVEKKQEELAEVEKKAQEAAVSQISTLAEANKTLEDASKADQPAGNVQKEEKKGQKEDHTVDGTVLDTDSVKGRLTENDMTEAEKEELEPVIYTSIDIRL